MKESILAVILILIILFVTGILAFNTGLFYERSVTVNKLQHDIKAHEERLQETHKMMLDIEEEHQAKIKRLENVVFDGEAQEEWKENPWGDGKIKATSEDINEIKDIKAE